jgi:hypothetical protein
MTPLLPRRFIMALSWHPTVSTKLPRQLAISLDRPVLNGMTPSDRNAAVRRLARLLMEAAGVDPKEIGDDER